MNRQYRLILAVSILASFVAFLDGSVVNVALPVISRDLGGGLITQLWVVDAYLLALGSLILLAGSLSDLFGQRRILAVGLTGFAVTSLLCSIAPNSILLIIARGLQGIAGALLVPSSLALIMSNITGPRRAKAIGSWTAWTGVAFVIGPLLGGFLVDNGSWRLIFAINVLPIALCLWLLHLIDKTDTPKGAKIDVLGALMCSFGLIGFVFAMIEQRQYGWSSPLIYLPLIGGLLLLLLFVRYESRTSNAMLPLTLFKVRNFSVGNIATLAIYSGLSIATFLIAVYLQQVGGFSAFAAGLALIPVTVIMFFLSPVFGSLTGRYGPRVFMTLGPIIAGAGFLLMLKISEPLNYWTQLFPGILGFSIGLSMTVAPLTSAVLADIDSSRSGIASAVNNAIARVAGLIAIAFIGVIVGSKLDIYGFRRAILITAILLICGGLISWFGIRNSSLGSAESRAS